MSRGDDASDERAQGDGADRARGDGGSRASGSRDGHRPAWLNVASEVQRQTWENAGELVETLTLAPERIHEAAEVEVGQTPSEVVYSENKLDLLHYEPRTEDQLDVPVLVVYALINKPYILDLQPDRSVIRRLLDAGLDVYLIDWGEPSTLDSSLGLYDYVERYVGNCVDEVRERSGQDAINVLGYCMGGTMSAMYAALYPEKVRNLGLMATGLSYEESSGTISKWGGEEYDPSKLTETFGNAPGEMLSLGFAMLDPVQNFVTKYERLYDNLEDEEFVKNFVRMERWVRDSPDVAGGAYEEFVEWFYQEDRFMENELYLGDRHVDPQHIDMPVLQLVAEYDHLVPPESSLPFNDVVGSDDVTVIESPTGHIGLSVSSKAHEEVWPKAIEWFVERSRSEEESAGEPGAEAEASTEATPEAETGTDETPETEASADEAVEAESGEPAATPESVETTESAEVETTESAEAETTESAETETTTPSETDAAESTEVADDQTVTDEPTVADEPSVTDESAVTEEDDATEAGTGAEGTSLAVIQGIGPAYEERLGEAGVESVEALAAADEVDLARRTTLSEKRIQRWIELAEDHLGR